MRSPTPAVLLAMALAALGVLAPTAAAVSASPITPTITQFSGGLDSYAEPLAITAGPENTLWFGQRAPNAAIDRITLAGGISSYATFNTAEVGAVAEGPEGNIWFTEAGGGAEIAMVEPASGVRVGYPQPSSAMLTAVVAGPEGDMWFAGEKGSVAALWRLVPATGEINGEFKIPTANSKPLGLAVGPEGALWFTESNNPGAIGRFEPATKVFSEFKLPTSNSGPTGIARGPEGDIWFTEATSAGAIGRIVPGTPGVQEFTTGLTQGKPQQIVAGSDGDLYFTESSSGGAIGQITPQGVITEFKTGLTEKSEPWGIATGPDGNIWFTERNSPARIGRLSMPPSASSPAATSVGFQSAMLTALVADKAQATNYFFEYGPSTSYGSQTPRSSALASASALVVSAALSGLSASTTYNFRVVVENPTGTVYGADATFTTAPTPPAEQLTPGLTSNSPLVSKAVLAVQGTDAGAAPAAGTILVENAAGQYVPLTGPQVLPLGTIIDATKGVVKLITALPKHGETQAVTVWGGRFKITQSKHGNGLTHIILMGARPWCARNGLAHTASKATKRGKSRKLWAEDNHGRYSTYGANSVATVLGTEWETVDSCAGTLTRVMKGKVSVRNLHTHKTVLVKAGHSYLARP